MHNFCNFSAGLKLVVMIREIQIYISVFFLFQLLLPLKSIANENSQLPGDPEKNAIAFFEEGKFKEALPVFEDLVRLYPEDKTINYYLGACLIETKNYSVRARQALLASVNKDNPEKLNYYLGIAFHAENEFITALDYYARFEKEAKSKTKKALDYEHVIDLCEQGINPFVSEKVEREIESAVLPKQDSIEKIEPVAKPNKENEAINTEIIIIPKKLENSLISFQVNPEIRYLKIDQFKNREAKRTFIDAFFKKLDLDSMIIQTDLLRRIYSKSDADEKQRIGGEILENEQKILLLNREIPELDLLAHKLEADYWNRANLEEKEELSAQNKFIGDSLAQLVAEKQKAINNLPPETVVIPVIKKTEPVTVDDSQKGIIYKIQIGAFSKEPPDWIKRLFKKLSLIRKISNYIDENGVTVYTTGELRSYADAVEMQKQVKIEGVNDAIVAAYKDGKRIKVSEARKINAE